MKITLICYTFLEKEIATGARSDLVSVKELPKKRGDVTIYWQNYEEATLDEPTFFYMLADKSMIATLGEPKKFEVTIKKGEVPSLPGEGEEFPIEGIPKKK